MQKRCVSNFRGLSSNAHVSDEEYVIERDVFTLVVPEGDSAGAESWYPPVPGERFRIIRDEGYCGVLSPGIVLITPSKLDFVSPWAIPFDHLILWVIDRARCAFEEGRRVLERERERGYTGYRTPGFNLFPEARNDQLGYASW